MPWSGCRSRDLAGQPAGRYERFPGYGRSATDAEGAFRFVTLKPARCRATATAAGAALPVVLLARGLMQRLVTRIYFQGEALNETDPLLSSVEDPAGGPR